MAALSLSRISRSYRGKTIELDATAQQVYKGGIACFDTSTGLVAKAAPSTTMVPIGRFAEDKLVGVGGTVIVELFRELEADWFSNSAAAPVGNSNRGGLVYLEDDQTVRANDNGNANSVAGRCWKIDPLKGVLVEFRQTAGDRLGGLDA